MANEKKVEKKEKKKPEKNLKEKRAEKKAKKENKNRAWSAIFFCILVDKIFRAFHLRHDEGLSFT